MKNCMKSCKVMVECEFGIHGCIGEGACFMCFNWLECMWLTWLTSAYMQHTLGA